MGKIQGEMGNIINRIEEKLENKMQEVRKELKGDNGSNNKEINENLEKLGKTVEIDNEELRKQIWILEVDAVRFHDNLDERVREEMQHVDEACVRRLEKETKSKQ